MVIKIKDKSDYLVNSSSLPGLGSYSLPDDIQDDQVLETYLMPISNVKLKF